MFKIGDVVIVNPAEYHYHSNSVGLIRTIYANAKKAEILTNPPLRYDYGQIINFSDLIKLCKLSKLVYNVRD